MSVAVYREALRQRLVDFLDNSEVRLRVSFHDAHTVLAEGRIRNQFETGHSGGALNPSGRLLIEQVLSGVSLDSPGPLRPRYGYLAGSDESYLLPQYGDVVLRLRPELRHRTTFVFGDTLDHTLRTTHPYFVPSLVARPSLLSLDCYRDLLACTEPWQATDDRYRYIEAQIHGELTLSDLREIVFTLNRSPDVPMIGMMQARGISWRTVQGDDPDGA
jgi:hypothetical protein